MTCRTGKIEYASSNAASQALAQMNRRGRNGKNRYVHNVPYRCACGAWHLGRPDPQQRDRAMLLRRWAMEVAAE